MPEPKSRTLTIRAPIDVLDKIKADAEAMNVSPNSRVVEGLRLIAGIPKPGKPPKPEKVKPRKGPRPSEAATRAIDRNTLPTPEVVARGREKTRKMVELMADGPAAHVQFGPTKPSAGAMLPKKARWRT